MATNIVYDQGDNLSWPVADGIESGEFALIGDQGLYGVAVVDKAGGGNVAGNASIKHTGVFLLPVSTTTAADIGDKVYCIEATGVLTPVVGTSPVNLHIGWFYAAKGTTADAPVAVRLASV